MSASDTGAVNRTQRRRLQTRAKLVEAGQKVFAEKGVDAATIQDITDTADVGRGSFYNFFETKEDLVQAIVDEMLAELVEFERMLSTQFADPARALDAILRYGLQIATANPLLAWFVVRTQNFHGELFTKFHDFTYDVIERGRRAKRFRIE